MIARDKRFRNRPTLTTERLILRPFADSDVEAVALHAGDRAVAATTLLIPHPYGQEDARSWIKTHSESFASGKSVELAVTLRDGGALIGAIGLRLEREHRLGHLGYWIAKTNWSQGFCSEAAREMVQYGFEELDLNRIEAVHFTANPASGRVMEKLGMQPEGVRREAVVKWGEYQDLALYAFLKRDWMKAWADTSK